LVLAFSTPSLSPVRYLRRIPVLRSQHQARLAEALRANAAKSQGCTQTKHAMSFEAVRRLEIPWFRVPVASANGNE
jgi:hypothetical protein